MDELKTLSTRMSGRIRFPEDAGGKKLLFGGLLRSTVPAGKIKAIKLPPSASKIVSVKAADIPGAAYIEFGKEHIQVLAETDILWHGQPILAAACPNLDDLEDWLSRVEMRIETPRSQQPGKIVEILREKGIPARIFSKASQVIEESISIPAREDARQPVSVTCLKDRANFVIHASSSWPAAIRRSVAAVLKIDKSRISVKPYELISKSNGRIWQPALLACHAALLASRAKRGIRIGTSIEDARLFDARYPEVELQIRGAVDAKGHILAIEADFTVLAGAAFPLQEEFLERIILGIFSVYPCRSYIVKGKVAYGQQPPSMVGPAAGFEIGFLAGELFASKVAQNSVAQPGAWRKESIPRIGGFCGPGITMPVNYPLPEMLNKALVLSDFKRKHASFEQTSWGRTNLTHKPEFCRGIGLSCAWFGNGFLTTSKNLGAASLSLTMDLGGSLTVNMPSAGAGAPLQQVWTNAISSLLGIESRRIKFSNDSPHASNEQGPSILGQDVSVYSRLLDQALDDLVKKRFRDPLPIMVTRSKGKNKKKSWNSERLEGSPFETSSWGVGIAEIALSTTTMEVHPLHVWLIIDGGSVLMPDNAKSSVESSMEEALNWCLIRPRNVSLPIFDIQFHSPGMKRAPKDISTLPWLLLPAALVHAVRQASGALINSIPISPEKIHKGGF